MEIEGPQQLGIAPPDEVDAQKTLVVPEREPQGVPHHAGKQAEQHEESEPPPHATGSSTPLSADDGRSGTRHAAGRTESCPVPCGSTRPKQSPPCLHRTYPLATAPRGRFGSRHLLKIGNLVNPARSTASLCWPDAREKKRRGRVPRLKHARYVRSEIAGYRQPQPQPQYGRTTTPTAGGGGVP